MASNRKTFKMPNMTAEDMQMEFSRDENKPMKPRMNRVKSGKYIGESLSRKISGKKPSYRDM